MMAALIDLLRGSLRHAVDEMRWHRQHGGSLLVSLLYGLTPIIALGLCAVILAVLIVPGVVGFALVWGWRRLICRTPPARSRPPEWLVKRLKVTAWTTPSDVGSDMRGPIIPSSRLLGRGPRRP